MPRFLQKLCFETKLDEKQNFTDFKNIFGFCSYSSGVQLKFTNLKNTCKFFSRAIPSSRGDRRNFEPGARKTQNFNLLRFKPNLRRRLAMTIKGTPLHNLLKKPLTNLFIDDSSEEYAFPRVLNPSNTSSSKFSSMASKF